MYLCVWWVVEFFCLFLITHPLLSAFGISSPGKHCDQHGTSTAVESLLKDRM